MTTELTDDERAELEQLRLALNEAHGVFYADPGDETRACLKTAKTEYYRRRYQLDQAFREARQKANRKWAEKKKKADD